MTTGTECPANTFTGVHVPGAGVNCRKCGQPIEALKLKYEGMARAVDGAYSSHTEWVEAFNAVLKLFASRGERFTSEDITERVGFYRDPGTNQNNAIGALMSAAANAGLIYKVTHEPSKLPRQHGALIAVWRGR